MASHQFLCLFTLWRNRDGTARSRGRRSPAVARYAEGHQPELVAPGEFPVEWDHWPATVRDTFPQCSSRQLDVGQDRLTGTRHAGTPLLYTAAARSRSARLSN